LIEWWPICPFTDGLDRPVFPRVPDFVKSLDVSRIMDGPDILIAYQTNGAPLPTLNGFPARLIVSGWYATCWGEEPVRHHGHRPRLRAVLDEARLPDPGRQAGVPRTAPARDAGATHAAAR
jgi:hypothetical protein